MGLTYHVHNRGVLDYIKKSGCYEYSLQHCRTSGVFADCVPDSVNHLLDHQKTTDNGRVHVHIYGRLADLGGG